ncbi:MAG: DUF2142 domain-containing protein, partial [Coriobacteriales bacterium]|nr:DUF2142 domain-containing protein [Coriobacteriales bacterium]
HPKNYINFRNSFDIKTSIVLIVLFLLSALAVIYSMYLSHTFKSDPYILGVQGRYFLPILPMLLLAIRQIPIKYPRNLNQSFVIIMLVINMIYMLWMFATILSI